MQRRHFFRVHYVAKARVMVSDVFFEAMTDNLSASGLFIRTDHILPVGDVAKISFNIPNASHPSVTLTGRVVRQNPRGLAFEFTSMDYHTFANLKAFLKHKPLPYW